MKVQRITDSPRATKNLLLVPPRPLVTEIYTAMALLPGFKQWDGYNLVFRPTPANLRYIMDKFPETEWTDGTYSLVQDIQSQEQEANRIRDGKNSPLPPITGKGYQYKRAPRDAQRRALLLSWKRPYFALLMEQRTGKTKVIIDNAAYLYELGKIHTLVIVTIKGLHRSWIENEIPLDMPDRIRYEPFFMRMPHGSKQQAQFEKVRDSGWLTGQVAPLTGGLRVFAFNIEALALKDGNKATQLLEEAVGDGRGVMLVLDESTVIANYSSNSANYMINVGKKVEYKRILTGTQAPEGRPDQLFAQYKFLSEEILGFDTITTFRAHFSETAPIKIRGKDGNSRTQSIVVPGCKNLPELQRLIDGCSYRVRRAECMDLEPKIYKPWPFEMTPEQERIYRELESQYITTYEGQELTAAMAITRLTRLRQILCGWWPMEEDHLSGEDASTWRNVRPIGKVNSRMAALDDIIATNQGNKGIIWATFRPNLEAIWQHLGKRAVRWYGGVSEDERARGKKLFQDKNSDIDFLVANPASAGIGHSFSAADYMVYFNNSHRLLHRTQSEDRAEAEGKIGTLVIDIQCPRTKDIAIIRALKAKRDVADLINMDPKSFFMESATTN